MATKPGAILAVRVQPGARQTRIVGPYGEGIKVQVAAAPEKGAANKELCRFLAKQAVLPPSSVEIAGGATSRNKRVRFAGLTRAAVARLFLTGDEHG